MRKHSATGMRINDFKDDHSKSHEWKIKVLKTLFVVALLIISYKLLKFLIQYEISVNYS